MKKFLLTVAALIAGYTLFLEQGAPRSRATPARAEAVQAGADSLIGKAFADHASVVRVTGEGVVSKLLRDDTHGPRHQKFLLRLASGQTLLIALNIDLALRVETLKPGDTVQFAGEYAWSAQGGVVHWTHHDPHGAQAAGWLKVHGQTYQ